jgi:hypothetical protein
MIPIKAGVSSLLLAFGLAGCAGPTASPPSPDPSARAASAPTASAISTQAASPPSAAAPAAPAANIADAGDPDAAPTAKATAEANAAKPPEEPAAPIDPSNKIKPPETSEELQARAKVLFEAIVKDEPPLGDPFWFPKEPFIPLKDVKGPEKYWKNLHAAYAADIHKVHKKRKSWEGAKFKDFKIGSTPKWVPPGDEANKVGYWRSFRGKLRYELEGETYSIEVHTVISWQARWYITHLLKFKK